MGTAPSGFKGPAGLCGRDQKGMSRSPGCRSYWMQIRVMATSLEKDIFVDQDDYLQRQKWINRQAQLTAADEHNDTPLHLAS